MFEQFAPFEESTLTWLRKKMRSYRADAEEVLQLVYIRIWKRKPGAVEKPEEYLKTACRNGLREYFRGVQRRKKHMEQYRARPRTTPEAFDLEDFREDRRWKKLTVGQVQVAWLIATGFSLAEAAKHLGISPGAARTRLYEARKHFARRIA